jgi:general nucleoside transport system permease protein
VKVLQESRQRRRALARNAVEIAIIIVITLATGAILVSISGGNVLQVYYYIIVGSIGTLGNFSETLQITAILIATGLSFYIPARAGLWNIGAEGQLYLGAIGSFIVAAALGNNIGPISALISVIGGIAFGAGWGLVPGILKAKFSVDEAVTTLLMYLISLFFVNYLVSGPYRDPTLIILETYPVPLNSQIPVISVGITLGLGAVGILLIAILAHFVLQSSKIGFEIKMLGGNSETARHMGVKSAKLTVLIFAIAGALAGLAGSVLVLGNTHYLADNLSPGFGFTGIAVGALAGNSPILIVVTAFFFAVLETGAGLVNAVLGIPLTFVNAMVAQVVIVVLVKGYISTKW